MRLNTFLFILSFELIFFFTLGFFQAVMLLEESWMLSGCDLSRKSKIAMSLIAGQDTVVFANGMKQR